MLFAVTTGTELMRLSSDSITRELVITAKKVLGYYVFFNTMVKQHKCTV